MRLQIRALGDSVRPVVGFALVPCEDPVSFVSCVGVCGLEGVGGGEMLTLTTFFLIDEGRDGQRVQHR